MTELEQTLEHGLLHILFLVSRLEVDFSSALLQERLLTKLAAKLLDLLDVIGVVQTKMRCILVVIVQLVSADSTVIHLDVGMSLFEVIANVFEFVVGKIAFDAFVDDFVHHQRLI